MLRENGHTRKYTSTDTLPPSRLSADDELALRRAASLVGEDSPLRPGPLPFGGAQAMARANAEFGVALGRLGDAFSQIKERIQGIDDKLDGLRNDLVKTTKSVDTVHDRLNVENGRLDQVGARLLELETKHTETLDAIQRRVATLTRHVAFALGMAMTMGALAVAALFVR